MQFTDYHARLFARELRQRHAPDALEKLAGTVAAAQVHLNPHQVEAALFAFRSPLSKGALLADEVGLGKTIEAGLVISQRWAERKRRILVITPASLRKQWSQEMAEKFFLPSGILESKSYNAAVKAGEPNPFFRTDGLVICSYQFARSKAEDVAAVEWDLVVIDEAHRLRNVYKPSNQIANTLRTVLAGRNKLLLTATPLQNSLLELYGLVSFIDEHAFGDVKSFREQFGNLGQEQAFRTLKARLEPLCHRTLRRQVTAYVKFTERHPLLEEFTPDEVEQQLYGLVSDYLARDDLQALPAGQRTLITLVLRKLLASSTFAIAGALAKMSSRLKARLAEGVAPDEEALEDALEADYEALDETAEEWPVESDDAPLSRASRAAIEAEIRELDAFTELAVSIEQNAKGRKLLSTLERAFQVAAERGAERKAIIFTESRRTQEYLLRILSDSSFGEGIVLFNGSNADARSKEIYARWLERHRATDRVSGSKTADMRSALVDYFRDEGQIMIATEAAAEGINLQFCSLVINYDLPWNPQRIEQRIGRCHRYGQRHDVVVVNFLNRKNKADQRVYQLLDEKFQLFKGVFGSSDEVLGALESGVDFEKRIADIYQRCRSPAEIQTAFDQLQLELSAEISAAMSSTRHKLLENFDAEVVEKLQAATKESAERSRSRFEELLMNLTRHELDGRAEFLSADAFRLLSRPAGVNVPLGLYELPRRSGAAHTYRPGHALAEHVVEQALARELPVREVAFDYTGVPGKVTLVGELVGARGWLSFSVSTVEALDQTEERLVFAGVRDDGGVLEDETVRRMFTFPATVGETPAADVPEVLGEMARVRHAAHQRDVALRNAQAFEAEAAKLDSWADDLKVGLEREIREIDRQIKEARRAATAALTLEEKVAGQKRVKELEAHRNAKRRSLFDAQDEIEARREAMIGEIEGKLEQRTTLATQFVLRWEVR